MPGIDPSILANAHHGFEDQLVDHLQPIRGFALASSLYHLVDLGLADAMIEGGAQPVSDLAQKLDLDPVRLEGFLLFLQAEGYVRFQNGAVSPLEKLSEMRKVWPWYEMLIGGYAQTYLDMGKGLRRGHGALSRNGARVGAGSCRISHYDAIPLTKVLLARLDRAPKKVVDLGCGNALYLDELCSQFPDLVAIGVEPDEDGHSQSSAEALAGAHADRIRLHNATAQEFIETAEEPEVDALIIGFVLQEILGQDGRDGTVSFLKKVIAKFPDAHIVVIEVDNRATDVEAMKHPLAKSYYNPYYLVHYFTNQVLENSKFWIELFEEAGLRVMMQSTVNPNVDSTAFELGFLLKAADR
jgi:2-ketoarginine methyltransferase